MQEKDHFHTYCIYRNMVVSHKKRTKISLMKMTIATQNIFLAAPRSLILLRYLP